MQYSFVRTVLTACLATIVTCTACTPAFGERPNIVMLFSDDGGYADYGFQDVLTGGTTEFKTPKLDALAQRSLVFRQSYVSASVCSPSRAGLLTGRYQQRFGYEFNIANSTTNNNDGLPTDEVMIFERMQELGYTTGAIGKWHLGATPDKRPPARSIDYFYGLWRGSRSYFGQVGDNTRKIRRNETAIQWTTEPSFNNIPEDTDGIAATDDSILDNTIVIFANDNGGPPSSDFDNSPLRGAKGSVYEGGTRVPMIVSGPGVPCRVSMMPPLRYATSSSWMPHRRSPATVRSSDRSASSVPWLPAWMSAC